MVVKEITLNLTPSEFRMLSNALGNNVWLSPEMQSISGKVKAIQQRLDAAEKLRAKIPLREG